MVFTSSLLKSGSENKVDQEIVAMENVGLELNRPVWFTTVLT